MNHSYTKTIWEDAPSTETPISADNLNNIENGLGGIYVEVARLEQIIEDLLDGGIVGPKGDKGDKGDPGPQGPKGDKGDPGLVSHVGMIIHTTTLDTMAKVIAVYGGATWIQHSGYMLRGATTGVVPNSSSSDGGTERVKLSANESGVRSHGHVVTTKRTNITEVSGGNTMLLCHVSNGGTTVSEADGAGYIGHTSKGASDSHENMPPYKNVYIWERTE